MATNTPKTSTTTQSQGQTSGSSTNKTSKFKRNKISNFKIVIFLLESIKGHGRDVVLIDGVRTPFLQSFTSYKDLMGYHLARHALL